MEVLVYNYTKKRLPFKKKEIEDLVRRILKILKEKRKVSISLVFVPKREIKKINRFWRKDNKETTVLSFPYQEKRDSKEVDLGDIFLAIGLIKTRAKKLTLPFKEYFLDLLIHSICHLYGFTHQNEKERKKMENLEKKIKEKIKNYQK